MPTGMGGPHDNAMREFANYAEMTAAHQKDFNEFPIVYMFGRKSDEEIRKILEPIGAKCLEECVSVYGCGDVMRKADLPRFKDMCRTHRAERDKFMTSHEHLVDMFLTEMDNHEYSYTHRAEDVLEALALRDEALEDPRIRKAWEEAEKRCQDAFDN